MRDRLIELICNCPSRIMGANMFLEKVSPDLADHLLANGVIVPPCKVGDKVAVRMLCECIYTTPDNEECRNVCPFEDYCDFDECDDSNEGVFLTKISRIFNDGYGWKVLFEHCYIEADVKDIGTSFFIGENAKEEAEQALKGGVKE